MQYSELNSTENIPILEYYFFLNSYIVLVLASLNDTLTEGSKFWGTFRSAGDLKICIDIGLGVYNQNCFM